MEATAAGKYWNEMDGRNAMTDKLIVDFLEDGRMLVYSRLETDPPGGWKGQPIEFSWPLDNEVLEDLRWYLEDYLQAPYGVYEDHGSQIEAELASWGEAIFSAIFGAGAARDIYVGMRSCRRTELVFRSLSPSVLGLPWELIRDPARVDPLAIELAGVSRSLLEPEALELLPMPGGRLRVLMVISRPAGAADVGYRMIARPLLDRLAAVRGGVDLVVLRPPTLDALVEVLSAAVEAGEPFQVVHFDGHGMQTSALPEGTTQVPPGSRPEGVLIFEKPDGGPDKVPASRLAHVLKAGRVPLVVLNACQSGAVGKALEASVATRLLQEGVSSVVAMAYTVYAVAAAEFMAGFYERLFAGDDVKSAVTAGRRLLFQRNLRPSSKGDMPLADWVVPVHYSRADVRFLQPPVNQAGELPLGSALDRVGQSPVQDHDGTGELDSIGRFVGRDALFFDLERAARVNRVALLHGPAGTGKTELAKAFARWWQETGGLENPAWVFLYSFEPGTASFGLDGVISEIGLRMLGADFARLDRDNRRAKVHNQLTEHRVLLIWDNFEAVQSMADLGGSRLTLDQLRCQELRDFVSSLASEGQSTLLITSRTTEDWLGDICHIPVSGLAAHEAVEYAGQLLDPYPSAAPRRLKRAFGELLEWLDGHPLTMRLILPYLQRAEPEAILQSLTGSAPPPWEVDSIRNGEGARMTSLAASLGYSYRHLPANTRRVLAAVSLCRGAIYTDALALLPMYPPVPQRFQGLTSSNWRQALADAARVGLLTELRGGMYQVHPALPSYLAAQWRAEEPDDHQVQREATLRAMVRAHAQLGGWLAQQITAGDAAMAFRAIGSQRSNLDGLLEQALEHGWWAEALEIAKPLSAYWDNRGLTEEAGAWTARVRRAIEETPGAAPPLESLAGRLWLFFAGAQARRLLDSRRLDDAKQAFQELLRRVEAQPPSLSRQDSLAVAYDNLGVIAQLEHAPEDAETWFRKSLAIYEWLDGDGQMGAIYHNLGVLAQDDDRLDDAENWYNKSLTITEANKNRPGTANNYLQLGSLADRRSLLGEAERWYAKALSVQAQLGDRRGMAATYHNRGVVASRRKRYDESADWCIKALTITEELGDKPGMAAAYHHLGVVAQETHRLNEAEEWYAKELPIAEELGDQERIAGIYNNLGAVAKLRGQLDAAEGWFAKALTIKEKLGYPAGLASTYYALGELCECSERYDEAVTWYKKYLAIAEKSGDLPSMAKVYYQLGALAQNRERAQEALDWFSKALTIEQDRGARRSEAAIYSNMAMIAYQGGRSTEAHSWCAKSVAIKEELGDLAGVAFTYYRMGLNAESAGHIDEAEDMYAKVIALKHELHESADLAGAYFQQAIIVLKRREVHAALELIIRCIILYDTFPHPDTGHAPDVLVGFVRILGMEELAKSWQAVAGYPLPPSVGNYVRTSPGLADT